MEMISIILKGFFKSFIFPKVMPRFIIQKKSIYAFLNSLLIQVGLNNNLLSIIDLFNIIKQLKLSSSLSKYSRIHTIAYVFTCSLNS